MTEEMKQCPFCGETIFEAAVKCPYCGKFLEPAEKICGLESKKMVVEKNPTLGYDIVSLIMIALWLLIVVSYFIEDASHEAASEVSDMALGAIIITLFPMIYGILGIINKNKVLGIITVVLCSITLFLSLLMFIVF